MSKDVRTSCICILENRAIICKYIELIQFFKYQLRKNVNVP